MSAAAVQMEALELVEGISVAPDGPWFDHPKYGKVAKLHIIRPGLGKGRGRHIYEASMLQRDAGVFVGWKMFQDHLSDAAKRALGGFPRRIRDTGGILKETFWDGSVPADPQRGWGEGAVVGYARVVPLIRELIDTDPALVEASINATATGVKPVHHGGSTAWLVEGFRPTGSVDFVTEAGAGGKVVSLLESAALREESLTEARAIEADLLYDLGSDDFRDWLSRERPELLEALGKPREEEEMADAITPKALQEALTAAEDGKTPLIDQIIGDRLDPERLAEALVPKLQGLVQTSVENAVKGLGDSVLTDARADADRGNRLRDMRDLAHGLIEESRLPAVYQDRVKREFRLTEAGPTTKLDLIDEIDGEGNVVKRAEDKLRDAVEAELKEARELLQAASPTQVRGMGAVAPADGSGGKKDDEKSTGSELTDELLTEAKFEPDDLEDLYSGIFAVRS